MIRNLTLVFFISCALAAMAQKHQLRIGGGIGALPYEGSLGAWNIEIQYEREITPPLSGFAALGISFEDIAGEGSYALGEWYRIWRYEMSERLFYFDVGIRPRMFKIGKRYEMRAALGGSVALSIFNYPKNIVINKGVLRKDDVSQKVVVWMFLLGLENRVHITDRFSISLSTNYRITPDAKRPLTLTYREIREVGGSSMSTGYLGITYSTNIVLQFGYVF